MTRFRGRPAAGRVAAALLAGALATIAADPGTMAEPQRNTQGAAIATGQAAPAIETPLAGFGLKAGRAQRQLEARFDAQLDPERLRQTMRRLSAHPHHVGSPYGKTNAHWIAEQFESWGFETRIEVFHVLFPTPLRRHVEMLKPRHHVAKLEEPAIPEDATSNQQAQMLPPYNAYSVDGDVEGELVYVNYGVPEDYDVLERMGIDVRGKLVIARYGRSWRGIKPKVAAEHGAIGCLLYSDPRDDGFHQGDVYPQGPFKNEHGVQRGSVADMPRYPGDPLTPGVGATLNAQRLERKQATTLTRIPVLPLSHADALPLLAELTGPVAPADWRGALPVTYHVGPGATRVRLTLEFDWQIVPAYDVIAMLRGNDLPEQWILRGNHHDAWVHGADDPVSGLVAMMEEARAIAMLARDGWQPRRTLVYAAWDAEEPGLLGSTEWVETHARALDERAAVYINSDSNGRGFLRAGGSHTLEAFVEGVARDVPDPQRKVSVDRRARAWTLVNGDDEARREAWASEQLRLDALGSGSDYTPFLQHLGVASLNLGYGGENLGGEYHSIYDSFDHYVRFGDPDFSYGVTLARTTGRAMLRLADAGVLPFEFRRFADTAGRYVEDLSRQVDTMRQQTERENRLIAEGHYLAAADPKTTFVMPRPKDPVPHINLAPLANAVTQLQRSAQRYADALALTGGAAETLSDAQRAELDVLLLRSERLLTRAEGLPGRPWYRHHLYAPGFYTGYGVKTLPGVREAIEQRDWPAAETQAGIAAALLGRFAEQIDRASALVERAAPIDAALEEGA